MGDLRAESTQTQSRSASITDQTSRATIDTIHTHTLPPSPSLPPPMSDDDPMLVDTGVNGGTAHGTDQRGSKVAKLAADEDVTTTTTTTINEKEIIQIDGEELNGEEEPGKSVPTQTTVSSSSASASVSAADAAGSASAAAAAAAAAASPELSKYHVPTDPTFTSSSYTYVDPSIVNDALLCSLCSRPLVTPRQHRCGILFCSNCLNEHKSTTKGTTTTTPGGTGSGGVQCKECNTTIRSKDLVNPAKPIIALLDSLIVKCQSCQSQMTRAAYTDHWTDGCKLSCPFSTYGCVGTFSRSTLNVHIDTCSFAPKSCGAATFGCTWNGQRDQLDAHQAGCPLHLALPQLTSIIDKQTDVTRRLEEEIAALREALATRDAQIRSYREREIVEIAHAQTNGPTTTTSIWKVGQVIDALDTEGSWLMARILKVDMTKKLYYIHYIDWDSSWDESIPFNSPRLACAGVHTTLDTVEKHVRKVMAGTSTSSASSASTSTQDVFYQPSQTTSSTTNTRQIITPSSANKNKRKAN